MDTSEFDRYVILVFPKAEDAFETIKIKMSLVCLTNSPNHISQDNIYTIQYTWISNSGHLSWYLTTKQTYSNGFSLLVWFYVNDETHNSKRFLLVSSWLRTVKNLHIFISKDMVPNKCSQWFTFFFLLYPFKKEMRIE